MTEWANPNAADFDCVVCGRTQQVRPYTRAHEHKPPLCPYHSTPYSGARVRVAGMTRGDHRALNRLAAITEALAGEAGRIEWEGKYGRF